MGEGVGIQMNRLVKRAQGGDPEAFSELIRAHTQSMYRVAKGYLYDDEDVADAIQDSILACYEHLSELRQPKYFKTWLIRILLNKCHAIKSRGAHYVAMETIAEPQAPDQEQSNVEFRMLLETLDPQYGMILILYYAEGCSVREISRTTGLSESAVKTRLKRGREKVKSIYRIEMEALI